MYAKNGEQSWAIAEIYVHICENHALFVGRMYFIICASNALKKKSWSTQTSTDLLFSSYIGAQTVSLITQTVFASRVGLNSK